MKSSFYEAKIIKLIINEFKPIINNDKFVKKLHNYLYKNKKLEKKRINIFKNLLINNLKSQLGLKMYKKYENKILDLFSKADGRFKAKKKDIYKFQILGESVEYQKKFCPGGYTTKNNQGKNMKKHLKELNNILKKLYKNTDKIIFSNEAFNLKKRKVLSKNNNLHEFEVKNRNKITEILNVVNKNKVNTKLNIVFNNETYWGVEYDSTYYWTSHFSSIQLDQRYKKSVEYSKKISDVIYKLKENNRKFGGFAGDINLYLAGGKNISNNNNKLKKGIKKMLDEHNCILITSSNNRNNNIRSIIHSQWSKIKLKNNKDYFTHDTLIIIEPFDENRINDYKNISKKKNINIYLPHNNGNIINKRKDTQIFTKGYITDHHIIYGLKMIVYSGADADGYGNKSKMFSNDEITIITKNYNKEKEKHLKILFNFVQAIINTFNNLNNYMKNKSKNKTIKINNKSKQMKQIKQTKKYKKI